MYPGAFLETHPDKLAVVMGGSGFTQTFAELDAAANRLSHLLRNAGVQPGDHVGICMENHDRYFEVLWGCHYAGAVYTACSSRLTSHELSYILNDCAAKVFITSKYKADQAAEIVADTPERDSDSCSTAPSTATRATRPRSRHKIPAAAARTSPHRRHRHAVLVGHHGQARRACRGVPERPSSRRPRPVSAGTLQHALRVHRRQQSTSPPRRFYHAAPLRFCMGAHSRWAPPSWPWSTSTPSSTCPRRAHRITPQPGGAHDVRPHVEAARRRAREVRRQLAAVRHPRRGAVPGPGQAQMIEWFGPVIHEYYAGTEGNGFVYCNSDMWLAHPGTVGTPIGCVAAHRGRRRRGGAAGESGTIYFEGGAAVRVPQRRREDRASRHPKGWSTLGDVGYLDDDNFLYLTDRKAYMIISGGVNIYPQEAENVLVTHPKVVDVAVFGVPNDDFGEEVKAVVQPVDHARPTDDEAAALSRRAHRLLPQQLADVKCPRSIDFREELPRHPTGKLYKRLLKDEYWKGAGRSVDDEPATVVVLMQWPREGCETGPKQFTIRLTTLVAPFRVVVRGQPCRAIDVTAAATFTLEPTDEGACG
jgi:long-chain acyl-CoA synthetase